MADKPKALHARPRVGRTKAIVAVIVSAVLVAGGAFVAYDVLGSPGSTNATDTASAAETPTTLGVSLSVQPADGATNVALGTVITVSAMIGRITGVSVAGSDGSAVAGAASPDGTSWHSTAALALKTNYTVTVDAASASGKASQQVTHFGSVVPTETLSYTITPANGLTVGIAQPLVVVFNHPLSAANQAAILNDLHVTESMPVASAWHWFSSREVHLRPQVYWPSGEQVSITANLNEFDAGNGMWATRDATSKFTVGDAHISTANIKTDQMTVTNNGVVVATYPISAGRSIYPTMNGVHIDLYRQQKVHMVSSTVGIPVNSPNGYDEDVFWTVNISDGGEFVHAAPWSVGSQGHANVSHGCINISTANAMSFFNFSRIGDVIDVVGSPRPPSLSDRGTMDWTEPWSDWIPAAITTPAGITAPVASVPDTTTTAPTTTTTVAPALTTVPAATFPVATTTTTTTTPAATTTTTSTIAPAVAAYPPTT